MGTRNLTMVYIDGEYKVAQYGQWDGYPSYTGKYIVNFIKSIDLEQFKQCIRNVSFYSEKERIDVLSKCKNTSLNTDTIETVYKEHPEFNCDTGCKILEYVLNHPEGCKLINDLQFAGDGMFCEWGYVIDFDKNTFEIYRGFNNRALTSTDRFYEIKKVRNNNQIKLVKKYSLDNLPSNKELVSIERKYE